MPTFTAACEPGLASTTVSGTIMALDVDKVSRLQLTACKGRAPWGLPSWAVAGVTFELSRVQAAGAVLASRAAPLGLLADCYPVG